MVGKLYGVLFHDAVEHLAVGLVAGHIRGNGLSLRSHGPRHACLIEPSGETPAIVDGRDEILELVHIRDTADAGVWIHRSLVAQLVHRNSEGCHSAGELDFAASGSYVGVLVLEVGRNGNVTMDCSQ